jgi:hypothetical protein
MTMATLRGVSDPGQGLEQLHTGRELDLLADASLEGLDLFIERAEEFHFLLQAAPGLRW